MGKTRNTILLAAVIAAVGVPSASGRDHPDVAPRAGRAERRRRTATYHLGRFAVPAAVATNAKPAWLKALEARGLCGMNQRFSLGATRCRGRASTSRHMRR